MKSFQKKILIILLFSDTERNFIGFLTKYLQPSCWNCILRVYRNNLSRKFLWKKLFPRHFRTSKWGKLSAFWNVFLEGVVEIAFYVSIGTPCRDIFWRKNIHFLHSFLTGSWTFLDFVKVFSAGMSKPHTTSPKQYSREKFIFEKINVLWFSSVNFTQECQNGVVRVERKSLRKISFPENFFLIYLSRTLSKTFLAFWYKMLKRVVKTSFYMSIGTLWKEFLLWKEL